MPHSHLTYIFKTVNYLCVLAFRLQANNVEIEIFFFFFTTLIAVCTCEFEKVQHLQNVNVTAHFTHSHYGIVFTKVEGNSSQRSFFLSRHRLFSFLLMFYKVLLHHKKYYLVVYLFKCLQQCLVDRDILDKCSQEQEGGKYLSRKVVFHLQI